ncbi:MAG: hypothetical protein E7251_10280 [Paenibacillaceae bacterium]|nr:hypothetical protein [Paenibacillaceae bacterium]
MIEQDKKISSLEIRNLILDTLAYEDNDLDSVGQNFKKYSYQGSQSDLFRLLEKLAIKRGMISNSISVSNAAWGGSGYMLHSGSTTNFSNSDIKNIYEQFHLLLTQGIIAPGALGNYGPFLPYFHVTEYGLTCLKEKEILPYDIDGYLDRIQKIPNITEWVEFYIKEALLCYNSNCMEAAIIMLGLSSERIINEQTDSLLSFLSRNYEEEYNKMNQSLFTCKYISVKYNVFKDYFEKLKKLHKDPILKKIIPKLDSVALQVYSNFTRITRNGLAHPSDTKMDRIEVLMIFISFIKYCETQYELIDYLSKH